MVSSFLFFVFSSIYMNIQLSKLLSCFHLCVILMYKGENEERKIVKILENFFEDLEWMF